MISEVQVKNAKQIIAPWWKDVDALKRRKSIKFKPGLNIIFGPNGSGKSTLLTALARTFHCEQSGIPTVTRSSIDAHYRNMFQDKKPLNGLDVVHDGQPVLYFGAESTPGLRGGAFDDDFFSEGLGNLMARGSSGQLLEGRLGRILKAAETVEEVRYTMNKNKVNDTWAQMIDDSTACLNNPTLDKGPKTILLDEPDRSLAIPLQGRLFWMLKNGSRQFQIIVATHSVFAVNLEANYIELKRGYVKECRGALAELGVCDVF